MDESDTKNQKSLKRPCSKAEYDEKGSRSRKSIKITDYFRKNRGTKLEKSDSNSLSLSVQETKTTQPHSINWRVIKGENLQLRYCLLYSKDEGSGLLTRCEEELSYNTGNLAKVKIFGKLIDIPRKQVAHGDAGLSYTFSGNTVPALPWTPLLTQIRDHVSEITGYKFNFVLINRYKDGHDYMGEHKDDEKDLSPGYPIASLSLGQPRDFVFKHQDRRGSNKKRQAKTLEPVSVLLEHGSLLLMEHPTNSFWYHSLPRRTRALGVRINMTFKQMNPAYCKPVPGYS